MKHSITFIFLILISFSCQQKNKIDYRKPFKINRNLNCELLIEKGYARIFGEDVMLIGKKNFDTLIYYQIDYPVKEIENYQNSTELENNLSNGKEKKLCENGTVYWRNFKLELDSVNALDYKNKIDTSKYKVLKETSEKRKSDYFIDSYQVVNLIDKDTFHCSITKSDGIWLFQSTIEIEVK
ncbi:hypothetical protein [Olleya sp. Bg11-27]|uniref:hypothetical protein n=1 Tax=Olleya sp. Bg11-27 TaxID=2058135 RepID=UPI000C31A84C|nr:hypothetical protein [Olleya sp. Bg11-27]AUC76067.1 hypothetical protein CW732_10500 [Olleya sp. Bg11-27]